jgi:hypothetical protein
MKKALITFGIVVLFALSGVAQDDMTGLTGKGIKAGLNLADMVGDDAEGLDMKLGFGGGGFITYNFTPQFAIQPELLYMMKGPKEEVTDGVNVYEFKWKMTYLELPVLFKFTPAMEGNVKPNLFAGPAISLLLSSDLELEELSVDIKDAMRSMDFGIAFGGGLGFQMETMTITFDARYTIGLTKPVDHEEYNKLLELEPDDPDYLTEDPNAKNTNISILLGVGF